MLNFSHLCKYPNKGISDTVRETIKTFLIAKNVQYPVFFGASAYILCHSDHGLNFTIYVFVLCFLIFIELGLIPYQENDDIL